ncbi:hypothetical protein OIU85_001110 [Salix viminalis]|uniref:Uncharacterized protein n=1 Tax=Salix viminalis TaxID=40686 RepID=A0A9Q0ZXU3_SALVM|nr:hypothetical protein OIU85_001110 [Salix viminalis]
MSAPIRPPSPSGNRGFREAGAREFGREHHEEGDYRSGASAGVETFCMRGSNNLVGEMRGQKTMECFGQPVGPDIAADWRCRFVFGGESNAGELAVAFLVHRESWHGSGELGQWTFQGGKTQLSRERDVHRRYVDAYRGLLAASFDHGCDFP